MPLIRFADVRSKSTDSATHTQHEGRSMFPYALQEGRKKEEAREVSEEDQARKWV